jgi:hypothetical protein
MNTHLISKRPLSTLAAAFACFIFVFEIVQISRGSLYLETLNYIDGTTLIELGLIVLWGCYSLRKLTDFQAASFTLVNALSFIFAYEALYKWSFFLSPFRMQMPPAEFREFVIQAGIAMTVLTGFAEGHFKLRKVTFIFLALFIISWVFWLLIGYPQIMTGEDTFSPLISVPFTHSAIYVLNRITKGILFLGYLTLFHQ